MIEEFAACFFFFFFLAETDGRMSLDPFYCSVPFPQAFNTK